MVATLYGPGLAQNNEDQARILYEIGDRHFNLAEYDQAISAFGKAYELSPRPALLFNIAQAYRLRGDCARALQLYHNYLRLEPQAAPRAKVEGYIADLEKCVAPKPVLPPIAASGKTTPEPKLAPPLAPKPPPSRSALAKRRAGVGLMIVGLALAAPAIYCSVETRRSSDEVTRLFASGGSWDSSAQNLERNGRNALIAQSLLWSLSAVAALSGSLLYSLGWHRDRRLQISLGPTPSAGVLVTLSGGL